MANKSGTSSGIILDPVSGDKQADLQADRVSPRPLAVSPQASRVNADNSPSSKLAASSNITINFSGTNTANGVQASVDVDQKNTVRSSSSEPPHTGPHSKINVATSESTRPSDRRIDTVAERDRSSAVALANNDTPQEARHPSQKTSRSLSSTSGSSAQSLTENNDCYRPDYLPRSDGWVPVDLPQNPPLPDRHEKLRYEVNHFLSRAGQNSWESMLQQVDSDEVIVGVTPVTDRMNRPARPRDRKEYEVGQVRWTYIVETSSDPGLINNGGDQAIRTSEGLMLGKWRPTVVVRVDKQYCVVAELGRRRRQYLDGLSLSDLLGRCGVALDLNYSHDYDTLSEDHLLFRSVAKPLEIGGYEDDDFQLSGWSVVQPGRLHTLGFDDHSLPCGWLKAESTEQLLAMQAQMSKLRAIVEPRYDRKFLRAPLPSRLTPEQRTALSHIKDEYRRLLSPPARATSTFSGQTSNQQDDLEEFEALVEGNRRAIAAVNAPPLVASEPIESIFSIPDNGRGVSPSSIIQKAKSVSHTNWKSAAAAVCQKEDMLYQAEEEYETVEADRWSTTGERKNLKRKRDDVEMELELAQVREMSYKKLHRDVRSFQASQFRGQDKEIKLCNTLTSAFSRAQLETRRAKNRLDQRRRTPLP